MLALTLRQRRCFCFFFGDYLSEGAPTLRLLVANALGERFVGLIIVIP
jgi:hypothetical protein